MQWLIKGPLLKLYKQVVLPINHIVWGTKIVCSNEFDVFGWYAHKKNTLNSLLINIKLQLLKEAHGEDYMKEQNETKD